MPPPPSFSPTRLHLRLRLLLLNSPLRSIPILPPTPLPSHSFLPPLPHPYKPHLPCPSTLFSSSAFPSPKAAADPDEAEAAPAPASPLTQDSVLYALKKLDKMPDKALSLFRCVTAQNGFLPGSAIYSLMLRILGCKDFMKEFWALLNAMEAAGHTMDNGTYLTLLSNFKKDKLASDCSALSLYYAKAKDNAAVDAAIISAAKVVLSSEDWSGEVEKRLQDVKLPLSEVVVAKLLREIRERPLKALAFFRWVGQRPDYKHGSVAYNAMARVLGRQESVEKFWSLIQEMKEEGHDMDIDTYIKLSRQFQRSWMMKEAVELYEHMMDGPYKPAIQDCAVLLRHISLSPSPDLELVHRVVRKYEAAGYSLSKAVYDGIHRSLTSTGSFNEAEDILKKMKLEGHEPDNITYSQLVYGLCKAKRFDDACKVLDEMESIGCIPDLKTWTVLIQGHCTAGEVDKALECLTKMIERNCEADGDVLDILVKGLCNKNRADSAYTLFIEMVEKARLRPWQATYKYLIQELVKARMLEEALELLRSMKNHKFPAFSDPFPPYIAKFGTIEDAREFLKALTKNNYPSPAVYLHVFKSFFDEGRHSEAQDLVVKCPHHIRKHRDISKLFDSTKVEVAA